VAVRSAGGLLWIIAIAILIASTLAMAMIVHAQRARSGGASVAHGAVALPDGITAIGRLPAQMSIASLDGGVATMIVRDRRDGIAGGLMQDFRHGARHLRLTARIYRTPLGAWDAYLGAAQFLHRILPDPVLHARIRPIQHVGTAATLGTYASAYGSLRYSAASLVAVQGRTVCETQAFPDGMSDGNPSHDPGDLTALVQRCLADVPAL
jgi:hypothetical protein